MILLIDNYDSFVYNLYQMVGAIYPDIQVLRNDAVDVAGIRSLAPEGLILSPGPGRPVDAGVCEQAVREAAGELPILGVCLGHQAICEAYGARVGYAKELMHGKVSTARQQGASPLFAGLPERFEVARYHSLAADAESLPRELAVTLCTDDGEVMAVEDAAKQVYGLQFHPESVMTPQGGAMLSNFIDIVKRFKA